ncbi:amidohydrolase [Streptomyces sp. NPDC048566]|uniref:amidohydrolase n=1 Tax=Streptomyces sp. NPDC048566 TaxID=3365569 RepID=UPI00371ABFB1
MPVDVHQHIWPAAFVELLRARTAPPRLDGWTLHLDGEPPYTIDPRDHDIERRRRLAVADGLDLALVSLSSPLGVEQLPPEESLPLLDAFHAGALALPAPFGLWASPCLSAPDPGAVERTLRRGCAGLQLPATAILDSEGLRACAPLLSVLERLDKPLFLHPGPAPAAATGTPPWWAALVPYPQQLHGAWYAFRAFGRARHPALRVCFAALAGLAPLHGERLAARGGGGRGEVDFDVFYDTSSYGTRAVDALVRVVGVDVVVAGSDRPWAAPVVTDPGADAVVHALRSVNPARLLHGGGRSVPRAPSWKGTPP